MFSRYKFSQKVAKKWCFSGWFWNYRCR